MARYENEDVSVRLYWTAELQLALAASRLEVADVAHFQAGLGFDGGQKGAELREGRVRQEPQPRRGMKCGRFAAIFPHAQLIRRRRFVIASSMSCSLAPFIVMQVYCHAH